MRKFWEKPIIGIYKITHRDSGKCYIGQSVDIFARWKVHSNLAVKKKSKLQNAFVAHGIKHFSFEVVEECTKEMLNDREIFWIAFFGSFGEGGYNLTSGGGQGVTVSDETKAKKSASMKGRTCSEEHKANVSASKKGKKLGPRSEESRKKQSSTTRGKPKPKVQCPHCAKEGGQGVMSRFHFENCKIYKELGVPKLGEEDIAEVTRMPFLPPCALN